ncbi:pyridoxal phosphate-dependent aminotransferase [Desulforamulus ruminis]|uniref:Aminotransferase n=1 Tax=Desulforamulus ruminis (strain ATCC 23193 / DSM 2154 / NCIMB 8452 / DL) TaxID=696281 RepID=F6DMA0_DESRL|nr:pyridoxal phosphate-dependent aminotransferase [Desulforamulus ruminis]AEG60567.1 aminotransferase class I and II [Desulforamulus ruminis DSM 2154]
MRLAERAMGISPSPTLSIDAKAKQLKASGVKVISFGVGEPDFDTPEHIKEAAIAAIKAGDTRYTPVGGTLKLKEAIIDKLRRENGLEYQPNQIVVSTGAKQSLYNAFQVLCQPGDQVILPAPYWVTHLEQIKLAGAEPVIVQTRQENGFKLTAEELQAAITPKTRVFLLNSPSNPTGGVYQKDELAALGRVLLENNIAVISDEIYEKLMYDGLEHVSIASISPELKENTVVINGVSKAYAMTGWRIGYAAAPAPVAKAMTDLQSHATSNPTSISQAASVAALNGPQEPVQAMVLEFLKRRDYMLERLNAIPGVVCPRPNGAFYLYPNVSSYFGKTHRGQAVNNATDMANLLLEIAEVAVVPGIAFGGDDFIRLSYATSLENIKEGLDRIEKFLAELS